LTSYHNAKKQNNKCNKNNVQRAVYTCNIICVSFQMLVATKTALRFQ